ncbi:MAG: fused MFS/spermidine synthase [Flavobacteriales bacterium]
MNLLLRAASWIWPLRVARYEGLNGQFEVCYQYGRKVLNTTNANQSFGSLHRVWQRCFREIGLKKDLPKHVLMLGLGGGSAVRILRKEVKCNAPITIVELDPVVERIAREHFGLGEVKDLTIVIADAFTALPAIQGSFDLVVVDVFVDHRVPEQLTHAATLNRLVELTQPGGNLLVNTMAVDQASTVISEGVQAGLLKTGNRVQVLNPMPENRVMWMHPPKY